MAEVKKGRKVTIEFTEQQFDNLWRLLDKVPTSNRIERYALFEIEQQLQKGGEGDGSK